MKRTFILGTDWWTDCDDAVAVRLLCRAVAEGKITLAGVVINACMEYSVPSLDGFLALEGLRVPIGLDAQATDFGGHPPYQKRLADYALDYKANESAENGVRLYRRLLAEAENKVELIEIGYLQTLVALLESPADDISEKTGMQLVAEKVVKVWAMAGKWDKDGEKENNFCRNARSRTAGAVFCEICPVPVTFLGWEVGFDVITGGELDKEDYLYKALCDHGSANGRSSWDPMLVLMALTGDEAEAGYTCVTGTARLDAETGANYFKRHANGTHKYVVKKFDNGYYERAINGKIQTK